MLNKEYYIRTLYTIIGLINKGVAVKISKLQILRILLVQEDPGEISATYEVFDALEENHDLCHVDSLDSCLELLSKQEFSLIMLDMALPCEKEVSAFIHIRNYLRDNKHNSHTPIIVLSNTKDYGVIRKVLEAGARDYLVKGDFGPHELKRSIVFATYKNRLPKRSNGLWGWLKKCF